MPSRKRHDTACKLILSVDIPRGGRKRGPFLPWLSRLPAIPHLAPSSSPGVCHGICCVEAHYTRVSRLVRDKAQTAVYNGLIAQAVELQHHLHVLGPRALLANLDLAMPCPAACGLSPSAHFT